MIEIANFLNKLVLYPIFGVPFIVLLTTLSAIFLTIRFRAINLYGLFRVKKSAKHAMKKDEVSGFSAFMSAAGATLGMGNIVGGAVAVTIGGVGTLFWIVISSLLFSIIKFTETYLGHKYRDESKDGTISGGGFFYIKKCLGTMNFPKAAGIIASIYAVSFMVTYLFAAGFQLNQISSLVDVEIFKPRNIENGALISAVVIGIFVLFVLFGGIKRIGDIATKLVPFMVLSHLLCSGYVIFNHIHNLDDAILHIIQNAFGLDGAKGGVFFVIAYSFQRMLFASDAGTGASAVANSNSNKTSMEQALIVAMEPMLVALMMVISGLVVILTHTHITAQEVGLNGIHVINKAFSYGGGFISVIFWINISLFGITTIIGDGYYVEKAWYFLGKGRYIPHARMLYIFACICCAIFPFNIIMPISDATFFFAMLINVICMLFISKLIFKEVRI